MPVNLVLFGSRRLSSSPHSSPIELPECPHDTVTGFPMNEQSRRQKLITASEVTHYLFYNIRLVYKPVHCVRGLQKDVLTGR